MLNFWQQEPWDAEEEEEEGEEGSPPEDSSSAGSEEACCEDCWECGQRWQEAPTNRPLQRCPLELQRCQRRLFAPYDGQDKDWTGHGSDNGAEACPWGRESPSPPWDPRPWSWVQDTGTTCQSNWGLETASAASSRTLSHPSWEPFFAAVALPRPACLPSSGGQRVPQPSRGPLSLVDHSCFHYSDPALPPGCRVYNRLSASSQEVLRSLPLNTPAPIMCPRVAAPCTSCWLSDQECRAVSALLELPARVRGDANLCPAPGAANSGESGTPAPCQEPPPIVWALQAVKRSRNLPTPLPPLLGTSLPPGGAAKQSDGGFCCVSFLPIGE